VKIRHCADIPGTGTRERPARDVSTDVSGTLTPEAAFTASFRPARPDLSVETAHERVPCVTLPDMSAGSARRNAS
jgi:hypothetical protein